MAIASPLPVSPARKSGTIALIGAPFGAGAATRGAELGPAAARLAGLGEVLAGLGCRVTDLGDVAPAPLRAVPDVAGLANHADEATRWIEATHDATFGALEAGLMPLVLGGDHSIAMGSASAAARHAARLGRRPVLLWIDAHADFNGPEISPSGNLHGMSVAFLTGHPRLQPLGAGRAFEPYAPADVHLIGARALDGAEKAAIAAADITCLDMRAIDESGVSVLLGEILGGLDPAKVHLHVSFDIDVVDPALAPGTGTPVPGGLSWREAHLIMEILHESGLVGSADIVELNPMLDHAGQTARLAVDLAASLCGKAISLGARARRSGTRAA